MGSDSAPTMNWGVSVCIKKCGNKGKKVCRDCFKMQNGVMSCFIPAKRETGNDMPKL